MTGKSRGGRIYQRGVLALLAASMLAWPAPATAGEGPPAAKPNSGALSLSIGVDWASQYYFRGIVQETEGLIVQPYFEVGWSLYQNKHTKISLAVGLWNSFHSGPTGADGHELGKGDGAVETADPKSWYEADFYSTLSLTFFQSISLGLTYTAYLSPNKAFTTTHELAISLSYDDSALFARMLGGRFGGFQPSITVAIEVEGGAIGNKGTYMGIAVDPGFKIYEGSALTLSAGVPLELGLGLGDYYDDPGKSADTFGYFTAGIRAGLGLGFIPARFGSWSVTAAARALVLGDLMTAANADRGAEFLASTGLACSY